MAKRKHLRLLVDELNFKPWFSYFDLPTETILNLNQLLSKKESAVGKGYLTIKG